MLKVILDRLTKDAGSRLQAGSPTEGAFRRRHLDWDGLATDAANAPFELGL